MEKGAIISDCQKYRYQLWRVWDQSKPTVAIVGLNPSVADAEIDDPTILRCTNFTKSWGYGGFYMVNLFAFRATDPSELYRQSDPVGEENEKQLGEVFSKVDKVICAWGNTGNLKDRSKQVLAMIRSPFCLQVNKSGEPAHPLYLKKSLTPVPFARPEDTNEAVKKSIKGEKQKLIQSDHISYNLDVNTSNIPAHRIKHFVKDEEIIFELKISDSAIIFKQDDTIIASAKTVYWYMSRVGEYYYKSNDEFDAKHIGKENMIALKDIESWKAVIIEEHCYLEAQLVDRTILRSVGLQITEHNHLNVLQRELNKITQSLK